MAVVCWSGGLDSTVILNDLANRYKSNDKPDNYKLKAVGISHPQILGKQQHLAARARLKHWFQAFDKDFEYTEIDYVQTGDLSLDIVDGVSLQPVIWLSAIIGFLEENEDLYLGYVKGDDIWHKITYLRAIFDGLKGLTSRKGNLQTPLEWTPKSDIIKVAKQAGFFDLCWWCELPADDKKDEASYTNPCGKCPSCMIMKTAMFEYGAKSLTHIAVDEKPKDYKMSAESESNSPVAAIVDGEQNESE